MSERLVRDIELLDALDALERVAFEGVVWRVVREGRDATQGFAPKARWDIGTFDVLYTSLEKKGAVEEIYFHLTRQPVFPSKLKSIVSEISVKTKNTLKLADIQSLSQFGISHELYKGTSYHKSQEIADAAYFLGYDGIIAPSARWPCQNLILFTNHFEPGDLSIISSESINWDIWHNARKGNPN